MKMQTLYQRVLGSDFNRLPPILQQFHGLAEGGCATGTIDVERSAGVLHHAAARVLRLPHAGKSVPVKLQVIPRHGRELWIRRFGDQYLETLQWQEGSYLVEKAGPLHLVFRLSADEYGLTFRLQHNRAQGLRLPPGLPLRVDANARGGDNYWHIEVIISTFMVGKLTTYHGEMVPQPC